MSNHRVLFGAAMTSTVVGMLVAGLLRGSSARKGPERGDGYDDDRRTAAAERRAIRAERNLRNADRGGFTPARRTWHTNTNEWGMQ